MANKYWLGQVPSKCEVSGTPITDTMIDGRTKMGPWGIMSPAGHAQYGVGLGTGKGQMYVKLDDGKWLKTEG